MFYVIRISQIIWCSCWMTQLVYQFVLATNASYFPIMIKDLILWPAEPNCVLFWRQMKSNKKIFLTKTVAYLYLAMHLTIEKLSSHDVHDNHNRSILLYSSTQHRRLTLLAACVTSACTKLSPVLSAVCHVDRSSVETMLTSCGCSPAMGPDGGDAGTCPSLFTASPFTSAPGTPPLHTICANLPSLRQTVAGSAMHGRPAAVQTANSTSVCPVGQMEGVVLLNWSAAVGLKHNVYRHV